MSENRCVSCGEIIPEGRQVCRTCEIKAEEGITMGQHKYNHTIAKVKSGKPIPRKKSEKDELNKIVAVISSSYLMRPNSEDDGKEFESLQKRLDEAVGRKGGD